MWILGRINRRIWGVLIAAEASNSEVDIASCVHATVIAWRHVRKPGTDGKARHFHRSKRAIARNRRRQRPGRGSGSTPSGDSGAGARTTEKARPARVNHNSARSRAPSIAYARRLGKLPRPTKSVARRWANRTRPPGAQIWSSQRKATVDQNSPFAKLLELRSILEAHGKNRL